MKTLYSNDPRINRKSFFTSVNRVQNDRIVDAHTYLRGAQIPFSALDKRVAVYNGKKFSSFIVRKFMLGRKFGEFALTKRLGEIIHEKIKAKKKKNRR